MKLETLINPLIKHGLFKAKKYEIESSPYAFQLLIKQLYKNPIQSIIRELISNAYDSHQQANNPAPIKVLFPTILEPYFIVEDFGTGLSPEDINNIYTVLFRSNRRDSNNFIGGFGLGAKCPFSYTDHFLITSFYQNIEFQYVAIINDKGIPEINLINELPTTRSNGLIIKIPVAENDRNKFIYNGKDIIPWFPNLETNIEIEQPITLIDTPKFSILQKINSVKNHGIFALIQNVIYPIDLNILFKERYISTYGWKGSLLLKFQIGELSITPNREDLNYDEKTLQKLKTTYYNTAQEVENIMKHNIALCSTYEDACKKYIHHYSILHSWDWWDNSKIYHISQLNTSLSKYFEYKAPSNLKIAYISFNRRKLKPTLSEWKNFARLDVLEQYIIYWAPEKYNYIKERLYKATLTTNNSDKISLLVKGGDEKTITKIFNDILLEPIIFIDLTKYNYTPESKYRIKDLTLKTINSGLINPNNFYQLYYVQINETHSKIKQWSETDLYTINCALNCITDEQQIIVQLPKYRWSIPSKLTHIHWINLENDIENILSTYLNTHLEDIQKHQIINRLPLPDNIRTFLHQSFLAPHLLPTKNYNNYIAALNLINIKIPENPTIETEIKNFVAKYKTLITEQIYNSDIIHAYTFYKEHTNA